MSNARRYTPHELEPRDLRVPDLRIAWATGARASSEYNQDYAASEARGAPRVFPKGGDRPHTWLAANDDDDPWLELELPDVGTAAALIVCETCGPGAVTEIRDVERDVVLYASEPEPIVPSREARLLYVPLEGPAPRTVRIAVAPYAFGSEYKEIDAVALLLEPLDRLVAQSAAAAARAAEIPTEVAVDRQPPPPRPIEPARHPLAGWAIGMAFTALLAASGMGLAHALGSPVMRGLFLAVGFFTGAHALELLGRMHGVGAILARPDGSLYDRAVPFGQTVFAVTIGLLGVIGATIVLAATTISLGHESPMMLVVALTGVVYALVRATLLVRAIGAPLREAVAIASTPMAAPQPDASGRFSGTLAVDELGRVERYSTGAEHLGSYASVNAAGHVEARNQYHTWSERDVDAHAPSTIVLVLDPGAEVHAEGAMRTIDVGLEARAASGATFGHFASVHRRGDPASLLGTVTRLDEDALGGRRVELRATHLVLGPFGELRRRVAVQLVALAGLAAMILAGAGLVLRSLGLL